MRLVLADVRFVLVGGLAVNAWGVVRGTRDVDIVADDEKDNLGRIAAVAVETQGYVQAGETLAGSRPSITALLNEGQRVMIETALGPLDVVQGLPGVPRYDELRPRATVVELAGVEVPVCSSRTYAR